MRKSSENVMNKKKVGKKLVPDTISDPFLPSRNPTKRSRHRKMAGRR